jgi:5-methylcytosine-specific restriction endonuclease McrA
MSKRNPFPEGRKEEVLDRDMHTCQAAAYGLDIDGRHDTVNQRLIVHHMTLRGMGGSSDPAIHDQENLVTLCEPCHLHVHSHPTESYRLGLMRRR